MKFSHVLRKVSHGVRKVSHYARKVPHSARKVSPGARMVSPGARKVSHGTRKVSHGARKVSYHCVLSTTSLLQLHNFADMSVLVCSFIYPSYNRLAKRQCLAFQAKAMIKTESRDHFYSTVSFQIHRVWFERNIQINAED